MWHGAMTLDTRGKFLMGLHGKDARGHFCPKKFDRKDLLDT